MKNESDRVGIFPYYETNKIKYGKKMTIKLIINDNFYVFSKNRDGREQYHNTEYGVGRYENFSSPFTPRFYHELWYYLHLEFGELFH